ncbi:hypothetical protein [Azospirillum palustre]|uniref:hypothetical protein n=1 Tax=Azospirillum palustre TaxID=2044885 RepID=UPI001177DA49|nr:hypothetical protein [Azospirillum palustre]
MIQIVTGVTRDKCLAHELVKEVNLSLTSNRVQSSVQSIRSCYDYSSFGESNSENLKGICYLVCPLGMTAREGAGNAAAAAAEPRGSIAMLVTQV